MMNLRMTSKVPAIVLLNKFADFHVILLLRGLLSSQSIAASNAALGQRQVASSCSKRVMTHFPLDFCPFCNAAAGT